MAHHCNSSYYLGGGSELVIAEQPFLAHFQLSEDLTGFGGREPARLCCPATPELVSFISFWMPHIPACHTALAKQTRKSSFCVLLILLFPKSDLIPKAFFHLFNCPQGHPRILSQSLRTLGRAEKLPSVSLTLIRFRGAQ